jgi:hypothetical protein
MRMILIDPTALTWEKWGMRPIALAFLLVSTPALACPKGAHEDKLSLDQVMVNFGGFVNHADLAALKGANSRDAVSDLELAEAVQGLAGAIDCADTVLADKTGDLWPHKYFDLPEDKRAAYLQLFLADMDCFRQGLASYKRAFVKLQGVAREQRDFTEVEQDRRDVDELADTAHQDLLR